LGELVAAFDITVSCRGQVLHALAACRPIWTIGDFILGNAGERQAVKNRHLSAFALQDKNPRGYARRAVSNMRPIPPGEFRL